jgi:DNA-directed RNA polymerase I, II, and III subunit RPABC2
MSIPVPPKKLVSPVAASAAVEDDDSENEGNVPVLPAVDEDEDDDTNTSNDASSVDDDDAEQTDDDEEDDEGAGAGAGGPGGAGGGDSEGEDGGAGGGDSEGEDGGEAKKNIKKRRAASKKNTEDDLTLLGVPHGIHFDDDEDEDDEEDEDADNDSSEYFQKLKSNVRESYVATYHPESLSHNYDEIQTLSRVVRNSAGVIVDDLHRTIPIMTKYEKTRILGQRAKQLNEGAPAFIKIDSTVIDGYLIAVKELEQKKTPFIIRRPLPNGGSEYWRIQDLEIL